MERSGCKVDTLSITVDYDKNIYSAIGEGNYDEVLYFGDLMYYRPQKSGKATIKVGLIHFDSDLTTKEILDKIDKMGYQPAELFELLAVGAQYPELQRKFWIVALGRTSVDSDEKIPVIGDFNSLGAKRCLETTWTSPGETWSATKWEAERDRFLIIKKSSPSRT